MDIEITIKITSRYENSKIENLKACCLGMTYFNYKITCGIHSQDVIINITKEVPFVPISLLRMKLLSLCFLSVHIKRRTQRSLLTVHKTQNREGQTELQPRSHYRSSQ
jgi:hypothetical protein